MTKVTLDDILRLQSNLKSIRAVLGWSAENLADCLAVSRATISYLENRRQDMSTVQYLAIKAVINEELNNADRFQRRTVDILLGKYEMRDFSSERPEAKYWRPKFGRNSA